MVIYCWIIMGKGGINMVNSLYVCVQCNKCGNSWSIDSVRINEMIKCQSCKSEFHISEGVKNDLKSDNTFSEFAFISNFMSVQQEIIKVGYAKYIEFTEVFDKVFKIFTTVESYFCHTDAVKISNNGFLLISACDENSEICNLGTSVKVNILVYGKKGKHNSSWKELLAYAKQLYLSNDYLASILLSAISFESYIDSTLTKGYENLGLDSDTITRFLVATEMPTKVNPLMWNIYQKKLSQSNVWKDWEKKVLKWRNEISHGSKVTATKEEAKICLDTIIEAIFFYNEKEFFQ